MMGGTLQERAEPMVEHGGLIIGNQFYGHAGDCSSGARNAGFKDHVMDRVGTIDGLGDGSL